MRLLKQFASRKIGRDYDAGASGARTRRHRRTRFIVTNTCLSSPPHGRGRSRLLGTKVTLAFRCGLGMRVRACYTEVTLNTAVVWCDGSGAVFDLRTPAFSFPSVRLQRNQNIRLAMQVV